ncbi:MAG: hypothetical protein EPN85_04060 [Bacteroidetes bacterium]|nr:MAG: hypothetical protein EPN85_04060 [Bacteroidota bacterium]
MKKQNQDIGYHFIVTTEQIAAHQKLTVKEIFEWLESMNAFLYSVQTPQQRSIMKQIKGKVI